MFAKKYHYIVLALLFSNISHADFSLSIDALSVSTGLSYSHARKQFFTESRPTIHDIDNTGFPLQMGIDVKFIENSPMLFSSHASYVKFNDRYLTDINLGFKYPVSTGQITTFYAFGAGVYRQIWRNNFFHTHANHRSSEASGLHLAIAPHWHINKRSSVGIKFQIDFINQYTTLVSDCSFAQIQHDFLLSAMFDFRYKIGKI